MVHNLNIKNLLLEYVDNFYYLINDFILIYIYICKCRIYKLLHNFLHVVPVIY